MADSSYIVEVILNARDNTSAAFTKLAAEMGALNRLQKAQEEQNNRTAQSFENINRKLSVSAAEFKRQQKDLGVNNKEQIDAMVQLEQAAKRYASAQNDASKSDAERVQSLNRVREAEDQLVDSLNSGDAAADRRRARAIADSNVRLEQVKLERAAYIEAANAQTKADEERVRAHKNLMSQLDASDREAARLRQQRRQADLQDVLRVEKEIQKARAESARQEKEEADRRAREAALPRQYAQTVNRIADNRAALDRAREEGNVAQQVRIELDDREARAQAEALATELRTLLAHVRSNVDIDGEAAVAHAAEIKAQLDILLGHDYKINVQADVDVASFTRAAALTRSIDDLDGSNKRAASSSGFLGGIISKLGSNFDGANSSIAGFDNLWRGLLTLGIAVFLNQFIVLAGAAAGAALALASSAAEAGAALGGALTAGLAQAIPVVGVLATAFSRVKNVMDAVKQQNLLQQQQSYQGAKVNNQQANSIDQVRTAQEALANALRGVTQAQQNLNDAREQARQRLADLMLAERGASLSLEESQTAIRQAAARGDTGSLDRLFLQRDTNQSNFSRTSTELSQRQASGINGSPEVVHAVEGLKDAQRAADNAQRSLDRAQRSSVQTQANVTAAAGKLNFLVGQMSDAERRLYNAMTRLQDTFHGFARNVSEPIINVFTEAVNRATTLLKDPRIVSAAKGLSTEIAVQFRRILDAFTSRDAIDQFLRITEQAKQNLKPLTDIAINFGKAFMNVAEAAGPALHQLFVWVSDISQKINDFFDAGRRSGSLQKFFLEGNQHLKAWAGLLWQIVRLFAAIAGPGGGAKAGLDIITSLSDKIRKLADDIRAPDTAIHNFFRRFFDLTKQIGAALSPIFGSLAHQFDLTFNKDGVGAVKGFSYFIANILIPAIGQFARSVGHVTSEVGKFIEKHPQIARIATAFIAAALAVTTLGRAAGLLAPLFKIVQFVGGAIFEAIGLTVGWTTLLTALSAAAPFLLIGGAIVLLLAKLHLLDDLWRAIVGFFAAAWAQIEPPFKRLIDSFKRLGDSFNSAGGLAEALRPLFKILIDIAGIALKIFGHAVGLVLGGALDVIAGFVNLVADLLSGKWGRLWKDAKEIVAGALRAILGLLQIGFIGKISEVFAQLLGRLPIIGKAFEAVGGAISRVSGKILGVAEDVVRGFINGILSLPGRLVSVFRRAVNAVLDFLGIRSPSKLFGDIAQNVIDGFIGVLVNLPGLILGLFRHVARHIVNAISDGVHAAGNALEDIGKRIIEAIIRGIKSVPGALKDSVVGGVKGALGAVGSVAGKIPIVGGLFRARGGPIPGHGTGDTVPAMLTPGEHVLTADEVRNAGGHGAIFALRQLLGGGGQSSGNRFAYGGAVGNASAFFNQLPSTYREIEDSQKAYDQYWRDLSATARRGAIDIERTVRDMRVTITESLTRLYKDSDDIFTGMAAKSASNADHMASAIGQAFQSLSETVYDGMQYIGKSVNSALKALGADQVQFSLSRPRNVSKTTTGMTGSSGFGLTLAGGGMIGMPGERGRDTVPALLGRGEAVLNWAHQKIVNSALWNQYGTTLPDLFKSTNALHAGTKDEARGFASGGMFDGHPTNVTSGIRNLIQTMKSKFPLFVTSTTDHSQLTTNGNVSDHVSGHAVDLAASSDVMNRAVGFIKSSGIARKLKQGIHNPTLSVNLGQDVPSTFWGSTTWAQHANHIHLALAGALGNLADVITKVNLPSVNGPNGGLKQLASKAFERVQHLANRVLKQKQADGEDVDYGPTGPTSKMAPSGQLRDWLRQALDITGHYTPANLNALYGRAMQESSGNVNAINNWDINAKRGTPSKGILQVIDPTFQTYRDKSLPNNIWDPLANAVAAINYMYAAYGHIVGPSGTGYAMGGFAGAFADGGQVPGGHGKPVPIIAHAGEWVLNAMQQSKLAGMLGTSVGKVRDFFGFSGGPTSFADGGVIQAPGLAENGRYKAPAFFATSLSGIEREVAEVYKAINQLGTGKIKDSLSKFLKNIRNLTDQDGFLDQLSQAVEDYGTRLQLGMDLALVGLRRVKGKLVRRSPLADAVDIADRSVDMYVDVGRALREERQKIRAGLVEVNARIAELRKGDITAKEQDEFVKLMAARKKFTDSLIDVDTKYAQNRQDVYQARVDRFNARTDAALKPGQQHQATAELTGRLAQAFGQTQLGIQAGEQLLRSFREQRNAIGKRLAEAQKRANKDPRYQSIVDDLQKQYNELSGQIIDQIHNNLSAVIDAINQRYQRATNNIQAQTRVAAALGNTDTVQQLSAASAQLMRGQIVELQQQLPKVAAAGDQGLYNQLLDQIQGLQASVVEATVQMFNDTVSNFETAVSRRNAQLDLRGRVAQLQASAGDVLGSLRSQQGIANDRIGALTDTRSGYQALLGRAYAEGNIGAINNLTDKINDLNVQIQEQVAATRDLTYQYRSAALSVITGQSDRSTGLIGVATQIVQKIAEISGNANQSALLDFANKTSIQLADEAQKILGQVGQSLVGGEFSGASGNVLSELSSAFGSGATSFASTIARLGPTIAQLESTMSDAQKNSFQALIQAMIDNTTSVLDNTQQIDSLNGTLAGPQSFTSSAWTLFREALFTGEGSLVPKYSMALDGGSSTSLATGISSSSSNVNNKSGDTYNLTVNQADQTVDPIAIAARIAFDRGTQGG